MNVVDSSGWLEYFADAANASFFAPAIQDTSQLIVPSLSIYEVFKRMLQQRGDSHALQAMATMQQGQVVDLNATLAVAAARVSLQHQLPLADSVILATAWTHGATLWTQDADLKGLQKIRYVEKKA